MRGAARRTRRASDRAGWRPYNTCVSPQAHAVQRCAHVARRPWRWRGWGGGALFVAALATYVCFFAVQTRGARPQASSPLSRAWPGTSRSSRVFAAHHSLMARAGAKAWLARHVCRRPRALGLRLDRVGAAACWLPAVAARARRALRRCPAPAAWALVALQGLGVRAHGGRGAGARRARPGRHPSGAARGRRRDRRARSSGRSPLVRHPIYLGWALTVLAAPTMTVDRARGGRVVSTAYLVIAMPWEERSLSAAAGPAYQAYCRRVRWRMVPGLY